jgi:hypothetical protein
MPWAAQSRPIWAGVASRKMRAVSWMAPSSEPKAETV